MTPQLATPQEAALLIDLAQSGNIPYSVAPDAEPESDEIEVSEECDKCPEEPASENAECDDVDCECPCHFLDDLDDDGEEDDDLDDLDDDEDDLDDEDEEDEDGEE